MAVYGKARKTREATQRTVEEEAGSGICQTKRLQPLEDACMESTESPSFILTVNLNLDEVQRIPRLCFKTKAKLLSPK